MHSQDYRQLVGAMYTQYIDWALLFSFTLNNYFTQIGIRYAVNLLATVAGASAGSNSNI